MWTPGSTPGARRAVFLCLLLLVALAGQGRASAAQTPPAGYLLQAGDEISVTVLPRPEYGTMGPIPPDGLIQLKDIAPVRAEGRTLAELKTELEKALLEVLKRPRVSVTLVKLARPLVPRVTVVGGVAKPGPLDLEEGLRVRKAIELAGGFVLQADLRRVTLVRRDLSRTELDLSRPDAVTDPRLNLLLQDGDSIDVPLIGRIDITVTGGVQKPGVLPGVEEGVRVDKAIELAGGALREADLTKVVIVHPDLTRTTVNLASKAHQTDPAHNRVLRHGDSVEVPLLYRSGFVQVSGEVTKAGSYPLVPGMALEDLIVAAEKLTLVADVEHVELRRKGEPVRVVNLRQQAEMGLAGKLVLEPDDEVFVPRQKDVVILVGAIPNPGPRALQPGQTLQAFLTEGHPETLAALDGTKVNLRAAQLIRKGEKTQRVDLRAMLKKGDRKPGGGTALKSGDVIFLPPRQFDDGQPEPWLRALPFVGSLVNLFAF